MLNDTRAFPVAFTTKQNIFLTLLFFLVSPLLLLSSFLLMQSKSANLVNSIKSSNEQSVFSNIQYGVQVYASLPSQIPEISTQLGESDARVALIRQYLQRYDSPLYPFADFIVEQADENNVDYRLTTAIAQQESNLCKVIPPETFNCWGWGIHSRGTLGFNSYQEGISTVTRGLRSNYLDMGYTTIEEIMTKYTPLSKGSWANGVITFMNEMH